jgi:hypothetical protein
MAYERTTAAIGLIDQHSLTRSLSPELMLVDPALAERARELLREPHETNGKGEHMSALGTHEITAGTSLGVEPPLSPPVVRGPVASALPAGDGVSGLPTPPPAIRPPESAAPAVAPAPAPTPHAEVPRQPEPVPAAAPAPPAPAPAPAAAPVEEAAPVLDYFAPGAAAPEASPAPEAEAHAVPLMAPAPADEVVELPAVSPAEPEPQPEPELAPAAAVVAPAEPEPQPEPELAPAAAVAPVELAQLAPIVAEPAPEPAPEPELLDVALPVVERAVEVEAAPVAAAPELEELFSPAHADFRVVVRLRDAEPVEVGSFRDFGTAMEGAQEVIEQFSTATEGRWPFYAGRFIRPDLIVSVDVVEGEDV